MKPNLWEIRNDKTNQQLFTRNFDTIELTIFDTMTDDDFNQFLLDDEMAVTIIGEVAKLDCGDFDVFYGVFVGAYNEKELSKEEQNFVQNNVDKG